MVHTRRRDLICFAHRGASGHEPENTLRSVRRAIELGAPWIEVDVYAVENELVVIHDERLERTTNGRGRVADKSLSELRGLDAGRGEPIPLLREVMDLIGPRAGLNVELKGPATAAPLLDLLAEYVAPPTVGKRRWTDERILVSSFQAGELERLKATRSQTRVGWLMSGASGLAFDRALERACRVRAHSIHVGLKFIRTAFVERAHARGLKLYVFTVNRARDIDRMLAMGVDGVFTDYPELVTGKAL